MTKPLDATTITLPQLQPLSQLQLQLQPFNTSSTSSRDASSDPAREANSSIKDVTSTAANQPNQRTSAGVPPAANLSQHVTTANATMNGTSQSTNPTPQTATANTTAPATTTIPTTTSAPAAAITANAPAFVVNPQDKTISPADSTQRISGAELKKRAKAEKAARRAKEKADREQATGDAATGSGNHPPPKKGCLGSQSQKNAVAGGSGGKGQKQLGGGSGGGGNAVGLGRRGSIVHASPTESSKKKKREEDLMAADKAVAVFSHLSLQKRRTTIAGAGKEIHQAILALGLQLKDYVVCGSSARCVAMLLAFKRVIESYTTPIGTSLARHLTTHLSHQISYLSSCRPLSISQGNAIRTIKLAISAVDPSCPESKAKETLCDFIDAFIREKITVADQVIANSAAQKVNDGDVILCYGGSNIVQQTLLTAHSQGKKFRVSIIDSRPLFEGKKLARTLANAGLQVQYSLVHAVSHAVKDATKVFLGAHSMTSNGRLFSRVGTAIVAMTAKERAGGINIPVIVCCETVKFTDRVALDSIVLNELADADELAASESPRQLTSLPLPTQQNPQKFGPKTNQDSASNNETSYPAVMDPNNPLQHWKEKPGLQLLNIMYDVTPAEYIDMVITEMGSLPPSAVPIVHRMSTNS
ncbi:translation initiation factor eif-2b delta subunit [Paracoccidioides lutzii Pb01]|uniref:Translation initiation factor eIF2B subunit delta n=1 Tax=Paracoccidioides lutzii (strain ATCC MYA-826 / Pb01) TaxID=502779 RepID=C1GV87_PARBA|nr:translation initiation factor eif-2b delta subunit [Paracoccidioides lutzii Pb01]EEH40505.2 translation initiation factor eif-2b delta subunit [Paracoccidioides lutzii Pb01]